MTSQDGSSLALFQQLTSEIGDKIHFHVDLDAFSREVWGVEKEKVEQILSMSVSLDDTRLNNYKQCKNESDLHEPFVAIADYLLKAVSKELGDDRNVAFTDTFWDRLGYKLTDNRQQRLPDMISTPVPLPSDGAAPSLAVAGSIAEFKCFSGEVDVSPMAEGEVSKSCNTSTGSTLGSRSVADEEGSRASGSKESNTSLKRSFDCVENAEDDDGTVSKKQRRERDQPLQNAMLPLYATETLASSSRYYVVGMLIDRLEVTICYFDRFLVTCVTSFSFDEDPAKLALVLYAMNRCDRLCAGFDPHLCATPSNDKGVVTGEDMPVADVIGSCFEYPTKDGTSSTTESECFRVTGVIRRPEGLLSRATSVYKGQRRLSDDTFTDDEYIHKLSWPMKASTSEIDVVKALKERLPKEAHQHLPEFRFTATFTPEDLNLPWRRLGLNITPENHDDRVLRALTGKLYNRLWEAGSIDNFKQAWLDCVECLFLAHKTGKVLHRDISEDNLMVAKLPDGKVNGVLNDWDMAKFTDDGDGKPYEPGRCTGTPPFMAIELLNQKPMRHYLRHDFESLLYILIWASLHYDLEAGKRDQYVHPLIKDWALDAKSNWQNKAAILNIWSDLALEIFAAAKPAFSNLVNEWIKPLQKLFTMAHGVHHMRVMDDEASDEETLGGRLTYRTFMKAINVTPRTWGIPNYLDDE